jgi:hypothetical protein
MITNELSSTMLLATLMRKISSKSGTSRNILRFDGGWMPLIFRHVFIAEGANILNRIKKIASAAPSQLAEAVSGRRGLFNAHELGGKLG